MSARLLRKVLKEQEARGQQQQQQRGNLSDLEAEEGNQIFSGDESESYDSSTRGYLNPFDILNDDEHDHDQGSEPEIADEPLMQNNDAKELSMVKATVDTFPSSKLKTKKKKKKKSKEDPLSYTQGIENPLGVTLESSSVEDNSSSHQLNPLKGKQANVEVSDSLLKQCETSILQVDPKFLIAENELRRIFGSKVVNSFQKGNQTGSYRQIRGGRRGSHSHRRTILVSPSEHWHRWDGSLSMELLETKDGYHYFKYVHSSSYSQAQRAFEAAKHDLNDIANILLHHSYHLDSLMTMAEYLQLSGEHQMSADAISKCLYALECAWHPMFSPLQGNCQLKYSHESNRPLFSALFAHMKNMDRRGCHRSALEICKLLLALDSDDPRGAMFCIDYFSLRAEEYIWLERFSEEYRSDTSLWLFPNFSYSFTTCRFYLALEASSKDTQMESGKATSADLLKQALMLYPSVLKKLVVKVPLRDQAWSNILEHSYFGSEKKGSPLLDHLINIYVERSYLIWRLPDLQKLLKNSALLVIKTLVHGGSDARDWACVREEAFSTGKNEKVFFTFLQLSYALTFRLFYTMEHRYVAVTWYSHLLPSDFSDSVPTMPPDNLQNLLVDPRTREDQNGDQVANAQHVALARHNVVDRNPLVVLFEPMLPWIDYGSRDGVGEHDDQHNGRVQEDNFEN